MRFYRQRVIFLLLVNLQEKRKKGIIIIIIKKRKEIKIAINEENSFPSCYFDVLLTHSLAYLLNKRHRASVFFFFFFFLQDSRVLK